MREQGRSSLLVNTPFHLTLGGRLLLAAFIPGQLTLIALLAALITKANYFSALVILILGALTSALLTAAAIHFSLEPVRRARHRLLALIAAHSLPSFKSSGDAEVDTLVLTLDSAIHEIREMGSIDPLTGVGNRRACEQRLVRDIARARRGGVPLSLAFFDLDHLKEINDQVGHAAGDRCLIHLVATIQQHVREGDWIARWGGDEFVVALWHVNRDQARLVCDRVLEALRTHRMLDNGPFESITASVGLCEVEAGENADAVLNKADLALLSAKREGRDRMTVFEWR